MTDIDIDTLTLAALLTTTGASVLAAVVTGLVKVLGSLFTITGNEARVAAFLSFVFVLLLTVQAVLTETMVVGVPLILAAIFGWYGVTRLSMSIYDDITAQPNSLRTQGL